MGEVALISCAECSRALVTAGHIQHPSLCSLLHSGMVCCYWMCLGVCWWIRAISGSQSRQTLHSKNSKSTDRSNIQPRINNQGEVLPWGLHEPKQFRGSLMFSSSAKCLWSIKNSTFWLPVLCCQARCFPCVQMFLKLNLPLWP